MLDNFEFKLTGTGWAELIVAGNNKVETIVISYTCDPLPDLLTALKRLKSGESNFERIFFDAEDFITDMLLTSLDGALRIELFQDAFFDQLKPDIEETCPLPFFTVYTDVHIAVQLLVDSLQKLLSQTNVYKYASEWGGMKFPVDELADLINHLE